MTTQPIHIARKGSPIKVQAFLANLPMFSDMAPADLDRIAAGTTTLHIEKGDTVFRTGEPCVGFHAVVYGQVKLGFTSPQGAEKVVEIIRPGQTFGEALMFLEKPYVVTAAALADSMLLHISKNVVFEGIDKDSGFARRMLSGLSRRLHGLINDVEAYSLRSSVERVIGYLLRDIPDEAGQDGKPVEVNLSPGKSVIASRLNMSPEHFSRTLHELTTAGLIEVDGRIIRVLDLPRLRGSFTG
jgi:CRP-like cAMP-binding protein